MTYNVGDMVYMRQGRSRPIPATVVEVREFDPSRPKAPADKQSLYRVRREKAEGEQVVAWRSASTLEVREF